MIEVSARQTSGIRPVGMRARADLLRMPVLGRVAAGSPIGADAGLADLLTLDSQLFSTVPDYLLRVQGDSMIEDGILDGDMVGVRRTPEAHNGQVVVARPAIWMALRTSRGRWLRSGRSVRRLQHIASPSALSLVYHGAGIPRI